MTLYPTPDDQRDEITVRRCRPVVVPRRLTVCRAPVYYVIMSS